MEEEENGDVKSPIIDGNEENLDDTGKSDLDLDTTDDQNDDELSTAPVYQIRPRLDEK